MAWNTNENEYKTEYLISENYLVDTMAQAECTLIETSLFRKLYTNYEDWILNISESPDIDFISSVREFYTNKDKINALGKKWNNLFRYYVFQKN
jgi:hypothetical protein